MATNKKVSKIYKFVEVLFVGTVFVASIISSHKLPELPITLPK